ncbi:hypothetical protein I302_101682 [Kwoniella bestiolae CBS 10118]|uniref:Uncharacterized protein n=1 Tax=Kwoniella bestiolae CBS 10118 TaxID=1296100 RepID=A0A1B9GCW6_9TREE|nr:hypothetical protein I302_00359 [Kwoniella bestiolae CBS 10118]OCF28869.1 hypothetical protein I302_00359 [Kwoniella bestiolae CBS 10118]
MFRATGQIPLFRSMLLQSRQIIPKGLAHTSSFPLCSRTAISSIQLPTLTMVLGLTGLAVSSYNCNTRLEQMSKEFDERITGLEIKIERSFERIGKSLDELHDQLKDMKRRLEDIDL